MQGLRTHLAAALLVFSLFLTRVAYLGEVPPAVNYDEAINALTALELGRSVPLAPFMATNNGREAYWHFLVAGAFRLFGVSDFSFRITSAMVSTLGMAVLVGAARRGLGSTAWLGSGIILAGVPWFLTMSRSGYRAVVLFLALGLALWGFWTLLRTRRPLVALAAGLAAALPFYAYTSGRLTLVVLVGYAAVLAVVGRLRPLLGLLYAVGAATATAPMLAWAFRTEANRGAFFFPVRGRGLWQDGLTPDDLWRFIGQLRTDLIGLFWSQYEFQPEQAPVSAPLLPWWVTAALVAALPLTVLALRRRSGGPPLATVGVLWVLAATTLIGDGLLPAGLAPVQILTAGIPLALLGGWAAGQLTATRPWILAVLTLVAAWTLTNGYFRYGLATTHFSGPYQKPFDEVVEALIRADAGDPILVMNEAHEPAVRWRLIARGQQPGYRLISEEQLFQGGSALAGDAPIYFASDWEAQQILRRHQDVLEGQGAGPYRFVASLQAGSR